MELEWTGLVTSTEQGGVAFFPEARHSGIFFLTEPSSSDIEAVILLAAQIVSLDTTLISKGLGNECILSIN